MNFKEYYTEQTALSSTGGTTWYGNLKNKAKSAGQKMRNFPGDVEKGLQTSGTYQLGKDIGKTGLKAAKLGLRAIDPFSDRGLLGKLSNKAKEAETWARTGKGFIDNIYGKKRSSADDAVKKGDTHEFITNIRNTFTPNKLNAAAADLNMNPSTSIYLIHPNSAGKKRTYSNIKHYANVVLDQFKHYLIDKNYNEDDSGRFTVDAFTDRTGADESKNKRMLQVLKKHGLLYDAVAKYVR